MRLGRTGGMMGEMRKLSEEPLEARILRRGSDPCCQTLQIHDGKKRAAPASQLATSPEPFSQVDDVGTKSSRLMTEWEMTKQRCAQCGTV